ncbi:HNH endonuclease [Nitriliruptoraceae bacterium ZYF776]|nr:HNH endonuclease [Profundirhabdus halotolerans]
MTTPSPLAGDHRRQPVGPTRDAGTDHAAPFGLPVLDEVPELAQLLHALVDADRAVTRALLLLCRLRASGAAERTTGVGPEDWLALLTRATRTDRRMLLTAADTLRQLPHLRAAVAEGAVSWAQLRSVVLQLRDARVPLDERLDTAIAGAVATARDAEPDVLAREVRWSLWDLLPEPAATTADPARGPRLVLQPRLDGSGGEVHGDLDPVGLAALDAATRPERHVPAHGRAARRAERLTALCLAGPTHADVAERPDDGAGADAREEDAADDAADDARSRVHLLLRVELETLLGLDRRPAQLLTSLAGGALHTDARTARRLAARAGNLRLIVTDAGAPVGVGRRTRRPPSWLRDAVLALHDTCAQPSCVRPASTADLDHARAWVDGGPTDVTNLAPLCAHHNRHRHRTGWRATQTADGARHWHHPTTGLTTATHPARPRERPAGRGP